ncbi:MAG: hypothetical protein EOO01_05090 [Chitinophagaceae bacterium]|nr:MAG: hypothetical protein EOO01_05090 [Chitinophagaceae bacterium]
MAIKCKHDDSTTMYFCTFTCYQWLPLIEIVSGYDLVYKWFDYLKQQRYGVISWVIMPNHVHTILYFPNPGFDLNKIIGNGKRFIAYDIVKRLKESSRHDILDHLTNELTRREKRKRQLHKVFFDSFDAKGIYNAQFFNQKFNYIHLNPVRGKWQLAKDFSGYEHSSASFYETGEVKHYEPFDYRVL